MPANEASRPRSGDLRLGFIAECSIREPLIKWGWPLLQVFGPYFKARAKRQYPQRSCPSEQRRKTAQTLAARRVALKKGWGLRWLLSYSPLRGCSFEAALPSAPFECNKCHPHLTASSPTKQRAGLALSKNPGGAKRAEPPHKGRRRFKNNHTLPGPLEVLAVHEAEKARAGLT